jgi:hypothetical protein
MVSRTPHGFRNPQANGLVDHRGAEVITQATINGQPRWIGLYSQEHFVDDVFGVWPRKARQHFLDEGLHAMGSIRHGAISPMKPTHQVHSEYKGVKLDVT